MLKRLILHLIFLLNLLAGIYVLGIVGLMEKDYNVELTQWINVAIINVIYLMEYKLFKNVKFEV